MIIICVVMFSYTLLLFLADQILNVDVLEVSDSTAIITLTCGLDTSHVKDFTLQQEGNNIRNVVTMCNISTTISGLVSGRVYAIVRTYNHQITCTLTSFNTTLSKFLNHYLKYCHMLCYMQSQQVHHYHCMS